MSISKLLGATMVAGAVPRRRGAAARTARAPHAAGTAGLPHVSPGSNTAPASRG